MKLGGAEMVYEVLLKLNMECYLLWHHCVSCTDMQLRGRLLLVGTNSCQEYRMCVTSTHCSKLKWTTTILSLQGQWTPV